MGGGGALQRAGSDFRRIDDAEAAAAGPEAASGHLQAANGVRAILAHEEYIGQWPIDSHPIRTALVEGDDGEEDLLEEDEAEEAHDGKQRRAKLTGAPALASVATLCNSAIGAGVLSLPYAFAKAGMAGGFILTGAIGAAEAFTLYVLTKMTERYNAESYSQLVRATLGRKMATFLCILMVVYMWGACNAYVVIMADVFQSLLISALGEGHWATNRFLLIGSLGAVVLLPLCYIKQLTRLAWLSSVAVAGFLFTAAVVMKTAWEVAQTREHLMDGVDWFHLDIGALYALPIVVFGFNCHANAVPIFQELAEEKSEQLFPINPKRKTSKLINMISVITAAIGLIMLGYLTVGSAGYFAYPDTVGGNVLNVLPTDDPWVQAARLLIGIVVVGHYPLNHHPARAGALDLAALAGFSTPTIRNVICPTFTAVFTVTSVVVSMFCKDLGQVVHLIGGTAAACLIFFNPGLMLINAAIVKHSAHTLHRIATRHRESLLEPPEPDSAEAAVAESDALRMPLLDQAVRKGIKKTGLVYSPCKSWAAGVVLVLFALFIFADTIFTAVV